MEKKKTMLLEFTPEEYDSIPSPKRTWVMKCIRQCKEAETKAEFALEETEWGFKIEGKCLVETGKTRGEAFLKLGYSDKDYSRIEWHGRCEDAVRQEWWVESRKKADHSGLLEG